MRRIDSVRHARPSLTFGLATGLLTTVHHLHAALVLRSDGPGLHVVWNEAVLLPATLASMWLFLRDGNRWALGVYLGIAMLGFLGLGSTRVGGTTSRNSSRTCASARRAPTSGTSCPPTTRTRGSTSSPGSRRSRSR